MHSPLSGLSTPLLAAICSFLPVLHNLSVSRQAFRKAAIVELALRRSHLILCSSAAHQLASRSSPQTRAALSLVPSLAVCCQCDCTGRGGPSLAALYQLTTATAAPLFLFSHLTSLRFHIEAGGVQQQGEQDVDASAPVQGLLRLIDESPASFASLARLHLSGDNAAVRTVRSWDALCCLQALTHLRVQSLSFSSKSAVSFLSALARLPVLECVDLSSVHLFEARALLTLDCHLWARRLAVLRLPYFVSAIASGATADRVAEFVRRLAVPQDSEEPDCTLPSAPHRCSALHTIHLSLRVTTAAVLRAVFSLASLTDLSLAGWCSAVDFGSFCAAQLANASWQCALQRLELPRFGFPAVTAADGAGKESIDATPRAARTEHESRLRALLARCVALTDLTVSLDDALEVNGCCLAPLHRLQRLCVNGWPSMQRLTGSSELSFPALREIHVFTASSTDAALETLLRACPALWSLQLGNCELQSWSVASIAVALCPQLVRLAVSAAVYASDVDAASSRVVSPAVPSPVRSSLVVFSLADTHQKAGKRSATAVPYDPSADLRLLASDPSSSRLRRFDLHQPLTPQQLQLLCALPTLTRLHAYWNGEPRGVVCAALQSLRSRYQLEWPAARRLPVASRAAPSPSIAHELCEAAMSVAPARSAGELIDRALAEHCNMDDLLDFPGVPVQEVKRRLIEELSQNREEPASAPQSNSLSPFRTPVNMQVPPAPFDVLDLRTDRTGAAAVVANYVARSALHPLPHQPHSPGTVRRRLEEATVSLLAQARRLTVDRCECDQESIMCVPHPPCQHGDGCTACWRCSKCRWFLYAHRRSDPPRAAMGVLVCERLLLPFMRVVYPLIGNLLPNNPRLRDPNTTINVNVSYWLHEQLELSDSQYSDTGTFALVRFYRNIFLDTHDPMPEVDFAVKYEHESDGQAVKRALHEASMLVLCETINNLRVPFLLGLVYQDSRKHIGLALHRIKGIPLRDFDAAAHTQAVRVGIFVELVKTLAVLHQHRIYHLDVNPNNIIVAADHLPYLIDFGLAQSRDPSEPVASGHGPDVNSLFGTVCALFSSLSPFASDPSPASPSAPPCIVTAHDRLKTYFYGGASVAAAELSDLLQRCACGHHPAASPAPTIRQEYKLKLRTVAQMCSVEIRCQHCLLSAAAVERERHYLLADPRSCRSTSSDEKHEMHSPLSGLSTPLLAAICSFLPVLHNLSVSRQAFRKAAIVELALRRSHLILCSSAAHQLASRSSPQTRAALSLVPSLAVCCQCDCTGRGGPSLAALYQLTTATAAPLFLFSHLTSLRFHIEAGGVQQQGEQDVDASAPVQGLLRLIDESPASFASLARLHLSGYHSDVLTVRSWDALGCLQALTHLRVQSLRFSPESTRSFLSALARLPALKCVDLSDVSLHDSRVLLTLDCHLWTRRLSVLRLPHFSDLVASAVTADRVAEFVRRLAVPQDSEEPDCTLPSAPHRCSALHTIHLSLRVTTAAVLRAVFSLASLTDLSLAGWCSAVDFGSFCAAQLANASWQCALQRLELPRFGFPAVTAADGAGKESIDATPRAARTEHESRLRALLARCVALTDLTVSLDDALEVNGCCLAPLHRLQRLCVNGWPSMQRLTGSSELSFPALREIHVFTASSTDAALETLLRACPALWSLQLGNCELQSWSVASIAVALCPQLVRLAVSAAVYASDVDAASSRVVSPAVPSPVRSSLVVFSLADTHQKAGKRSATAVPYDPSADLRLLASDPSSSRLRRFDLHQPLTPQQLQLLCALPTLTRLHAYWNGEPRGVVCAALQSLRSRYQLEWPAARRLPVASRAAPSPSVAHELCEAAMSAAPARSAGELIDRALAEHCNMDDLLDFPGVPVQEVKRRLTEELRSRGADHCLLSC